MHGMTNYKSTEYISNYLKRKGIDYNIAKNSSRDPKSYKEFIYESFLNNPNSLIIINSEGFNLESVDGNVTLNNDGATQNAQVKGKVVENVGGHAMIVTGITEDGKIIVSSWGKEYIFDIGNAGYVNLDILDFNVGGKM